MRAVLWLLLAAGLPLMNGAAVHRRRAAGELAAFANPSLLARYCEQPGNACVSTPRWTQARGHPARLQERVKRSALSCAAVASSSVTVLEGTHSIDGFRSNYLVARPQQPSSAENTEDATPTPIVLVHGFGSNKAHFSRNMEALAAATGSDVYALDLLGHGESAKPKGVSYDCSLWDWQVEALIKNVIGTKAFLVGHSLGGYLAMRLAARSPRDVAGLCLIAPAGRYGVLHPLSFNVPLVGLDPIASMLGAQTFSKFSSASAMRSTLEFLYKDPSSVSQVTVDALAKPWQDAKSQEAGAAISKSIYQSQLEPPWEKLISSDELREVVQKRTRSGPGQDVFVTMTYCGPVLTIWGTDDSYLPHETNVEAIREIRSDELSEVRMVDAGHCPHDEKPDEVNALIAEWTRKVAAEDAEFPIPRRPRYRRAPLADESLWKF